VLFGGKQGIDPGQQRLPASSHRSWCCLVACAGLVFQAPTPTGQVRAVKANDRSLAGCGRHVNALKQLAASCWGLNRHPGWTLVPEQPVSQQTDVLYPARAVLYACQHVCLFGQLGSSVLHVPGMAHRRLRSHLYRAPCSLVALDS
jgi:hypothetical protein